ncbi:MAG TPA: molecular chaperone TorD family protein [Halomonas sp.]|nr:molecular chaperone TorD family protein [Halomonas sp.]
MSRDLRSENCGPAPDDSGLMVAAEWLSGLFIAPLSPQQVAEAGAAPSKNALRRIGAQLGAPTTAEKLCGVLEGKEPESLTVQLQRRYTALFEGIFRHRAVLPYESVWRDESATLDGDSVTEMNAVLRELDVHISSDCCEPANHLAIELAALAAALGAGQTSVAVDLVKRLDGWAPAFASALKRQDPEGFYAAAGELLLALIRTAQTALRVTESATATVNKQSEGDFA